MLGADALALIAPGRRGRGGRRAGGDRTAGVRERDPRRVIGRRRQARARVKIVEVPQSDAAPDGSVTTVQAAEVTLPRAELERIWTPEYLERLARTYWRFLTRVSLGLLRVLYTPDSREIVLLTRPFVLLRFFAPEYETRERPRHGDVADQPGPAGGARRPRQGLPADLGVPPASEDDGGTELATAG